MAVKYRNGNSIDSGLSIENRGVHIPAKWKTNIWTIDDHGFSPACMKQKCFRTSRAFYLVSVILSKRLNVSPGSYLGVLVIGG